MPYPLYDMHGKSLAGLSTFSRYQIKEANRVEYTISDSLSALAEKTLDNESSTLGVSARVTLLINRLKELGIDLGDSIK